VNGTTEFDYELDVARRVPDPEFDATPTEPDAAVNWIHRSQLAASPRASQAGRLGAYFMPNCANFKVEWALDTSDIDYGTLRGTSLPGASEVIWIDPGDFANNVVDIQNRLASYRANQCTSASVPLICQDTVDRVARELLGRIVPLDPRPTGFVPQDCLEKHSSTRFLDPGQSGNTEPAIRSTHIFYAQKPRPSCFDMFLDANGNAVGGVTLPPDMPDSLFPKALRITVDIYDSAGRLERPIRHVMVLPVGQN
jgi:hypothetical protein